MSMYDGNFADFCRCFSAIWAPNTKTSISTTNTTKKNPP